MRASGQTDTGWSDTGWTTPTAGSAVAATIRLPGSKSMTNRALTLAALADAPTTIIGPLQARDTDLMARAITALGADVVSTGPATAEPPAWVVTPGQVAGRALVDVGNAGTVLRFMPPVAGLATADVEFTGDPRAPYRPVSEQVSSSTMTAVAPYRSSSAAEGGWPAAQ
jgi:3-phosphoshikimate 1-carboxyvinyltransferase